MRFFAALRHSLRGYVAKSKAMVKEGHKNVTGATRNYEEAIRALNSLQTNAAVLEQIRKERGNRTMLNSIPAMERFLTRINVQVSDLDRLNVIHVSGTKGKGSTCAFTESILRQCGLRTGFYSSPHLVEVRERIRINGKPLEKDKFVDYFWRCMDGLESTLVVNDGEMPAYFRFLTLLAYYVFLQEEVDVAIIEVGIGGRHDCTNVIKNPVVCGITMLGIEHTSALGETIEKIAWHKAGIMKGSRPAVTVPQVPDAIKVLKEREHEIKANLMVAPPLETYENELPALGLEGNHQFYNASLALQLCRIWLSEKKQFVISKGLPNLIELIEETCEFDIDQETGLLLAKPFFIPQPFIQGIHNVRWPGRNQVVKRKNITFYLDGAHTFESIKACSDWFMKRKDSDTEFPREEIFRVLVFNSTGGRDAHALLRPLSNVDFDYAVFCPNIVEPEDKGRSSDQTNFTVTRDRQLAWCTQNQLAWLASKGISISSTATSIDMTSSHLTGTSLQACESSAVFPNIADAIKWISAGKDPEIEKPCFGGPEIPSRLAMAEHVQVIVTGSLHLVGGVMRFLGPEIAQGI